LPLAELLLAELPLAELPPSRDATKNPPLSLVPSRGHVLRSPVDYPR